VVRPDINGFSKYVAVALTLVLAVAGWFMVALDKVNSKTDYLGQRVAVTEAILPMLQESISRIEMKLDKVLERGGGP